MTSVTCWLAFQSNEVFIGVETHDALIFSDLPYLLLYLKNCAPHFTVLIFITHFLVKASESDVCNSQ